MLNNGGGFMAARAAVAAKWSNINAFIIDLAKWTSHCVAFLFDLAATYQ